LVKLGLSIQKDFVHFAVNAAPRQSARSRKL